MSRTANVHPVNAQQRPTIEELLGQGEYLQATSVGEAMVQDRPNAFPLRMKMGRLYACLDQYAEAEAHFGAAKDLIGSQSPMDNQQSAAIYFVERARFERLKGSGLAEQAAMRAIQIKPTQTQWLYDTANHPLKGAFIIEDSLQAIYSPIPKSGSTSIKSLFSTVPGNDNEIHQQFNDARMRQDRLRLLELKLDDFYKFVIVRDDTARFLSYCSRNIVDGSLLKPANNQETYFGLDTTPDPSTLALNLAKYQYVFLDVFLHTLPVKAFLAADPDFYDDVFPLEDLSGLEEKLSDHASKKVSLPHKLKSSKPKTKAALSPEAEQALAAYYGS